MSQIETIRNLAKQNNISISYHAMLRLMERDITMDDAKNILASDSNQVIEVQSKSNTPGKEHADDRLLVYLPGYSKDAIIVSILPNQPKPEIRIITAENVDDNIWERHKGEDPALTRK